MGGGSDANRRRGARGIRVVVSSESIFSTVGGRIIRQEADGMLQRVGNGQKQTTSGEKRGEKVDVSTRLPAWGFAYRS